ncbi:cytochrome c biogenesis protein CcdA [Solwaraspora sp. WMMD1047]|uniref:cytochrome c biogenesis CcdA family protein n=1 Tax=Solwaraspora sp. WMMD1047 TaxID=3016102 RepID=UPI002416ECCA|nr:cytochrome c biogenesis protein CcdA [Solwaraspora sp. WMMD1047]MDG4828241.1 cytochrome c biogenesis protein CcdA [Solwaraspora sp. WMMD1047]
MDETPFALAVAAGMLAVVNPCGFALLPAYLSFLVVGDGSAGRGAAVLRALVTTAAMTVGFVAVFGVFGLLVAPAGGAIQRHLPWVTVVMGVLLLGLGGWLLAGRTLPGLGLAAGRGPAVTRSLPSMAGFGAAYAVASLSCTVGPFLAIVVTTFRAGSVAAGAGLFVAYAAGMGLTVAVAAVAVALARDGLIRRIRRAAPLLSRAGGLLLVVAGGYVAWYGWYEIRVLRGAVSGDVIVDGAAVVQHRLADALSRTGAAFLAAVLVGLLAVAGVLWWWRRPGRRFPVRAGGRPPAADDRTQVPARRSEP